MGGLNWIAVSFFVGFVLVTLAITYWAAKRTKTAKEFYAAGRSITGFQNGLSKFFAFVHCQHQNDGLRHGFQNPPRRIQPV